MSLEERDRKLRHVKKAKNFKKTVQERMNHREAKQEMFGAVHR